MGSLRIWEIRRGVTSPGPLTHLAPEALVLTHSDRTPSGHCQGTWQGRPVTQVFHGRCFQPEVWWTTCCWRIGPGFQELSKFIFFNSQLKNWLLKFNKLHQSKKRPAQLLSQLCKSLEEVAQRLALFWDAFIWANGEQSGFWSKRFWNVMDCWALAKVQNIHVLLVLAFRKKKKVHLSHTHATSVRRCRKHVRRHVSMQKLQTSRNMPWR